MSVMDKKVFGKSARQKGIAILAIAIILLLVSTLLIFAVSKSAINEQKNVGNDLRTKAVYAAAIAGLEQGHAWLENSSFVLDDWDSNGDETLEVFDGDGDGNADDVDGDGDADNSVVLNLVIDDAQLDSNVTVSFNVLTTDVDSDPFVIEVISSAILQGDTHVTQQVSVAYAVTSLLGEGGIASGPPIIVEDCVTGVTGNPEVLPNTNNYGVGTVNGTVSCVDTGGMSMNGSQVVELSASDGEDKTILETVFGSGFTLADLQALASNNDYVHYITSSAQWNALIGNTQAIDPSYASKTLGSGPDANGNYDTHIVYFTAATDCQKLNGGDTIYGIVIYESENCNSQGWGSGTIYGNVLFTGDLSKFTANANLIPIDSSCGDTCYSARNSHVRVAAQLPGSWKDF